MKKEEIHLWDVQRILFGNAPPEFLLEVFIRTLIVYLATLFVVRWLGKRMSGQISITEMAVMVTLGAIISVPMQIPDRGMLQGLLVLLCALLFLRGIHWLSFKNTKIEKLTQGDMILVVKDGLLQLKEMERARISHQQIYAALRSQNVYHLGKVKRLYLEACGAFSVYKEEGKPGLPILPPDDGAMQSYFTYSLQNEQACTNCGHIEMVKNKIQLCNNCSKDAWIKAVV
jgi:uncharacterized membrane protein YcaP (DUF421 family)